MKPNLTLKFALITQASDTITSSPGETVVIGDDYSDTIYNLIMGLNFLRAGCSGVQVITSTGELPKPGHTDVYKEKLEACKPDTAERMSNRWKSFLNSNKLENETFIFTSSFGQSNNEAFHTLLITREAGQSQS